MRDENASEEQGRSPAGGKMEHCLRLKAANGRQRQMLIAANQEPGQIGQLTLEDHP